MASRTFEYPHGDERCIGYLAYPKTDKQSPAVLVVHDWSGCNAFAKAQADALAQMGYVALAVDMYGEGRQGESVDEKMALMAPLLADRRMLQARISAALESLTSLAMVDATRVAVMGFCFGGLVALDLARSGASIAGAVSFHGLLNAPEGLLAHPVKAKILVLHGYDDPMVPPEQLHAFCKEMTDAKADWQVHQYGLTQHAFTNPNANDKAMGTVYQEAAAKRAFQAFNDFLTEIFK